MGSCQSHSIDRARNGNKRPCDAPGEVAKANEPPAGAEPPCHSSDEGMSRTFGGKVTSQIKIPAYQLALMTSPSERTNATQAMTPISLGNDPFAADGDDGDVSSELDMPFDEELRGSDDNNEVPFDEEESEHEYFEEGIEEESEHELVEEVIDVLSTITTPGTAKKKRMGLFSFNTKKTPTPYVTTPVLVEYTDDAVEIIKTPECSLSIKNVPLVAPPKGLEVEFDSTTKSVNPQTLASFNKMKIQAQQAESVEQKRKHQEKMKDRRKDIEGYNNLWDEYSVIQEKVSQQHREITNSVSEAVSTIAMSIPEMTNWFVDFAFLNADRSSHSSEEGENDDVASQSSYSLHSELSERAQKALFKEKARKRRLSGVAAEALACDDNLDEVSDNDKRRSSVCLNDNHSTVSDFSADGGSACGPDRNDDYGVLQKYRHRSIEQSVMGYSDYFEETPKQPYEFGQRAIHIIDTSIREEEQDFQEVYSDAPTPKTINSRPSSIESYLEEMSLPSVSIVNAETGVVRWREFPQSDKKPKTARKLNFQVDEPRINQKQISSDDIKHSKSEIRQSQRDHERELHLHPREFEHCKKFRDRERPKIKTHHPEFSSMSTDEFYRLASSSRGMPTELAEESVSSTKWNLELTSTHNPHGNHTSSIVAEDRLPVVSVENKEHEFNGHHDLLSRKVGTRLAGLIAKLKENGLGE